MIKLLRLGFLVSLFGIFAIVASSTASAATANTTISSVISPVIGLFTTGGTVSLNVTPTGAGAQTVASDTVNVSTNDSAGYTLQLSTSTATVTLTSGANTIAASAGTQAAPIAMVANSWGYRVDSLGGFGAGPTSTATSAVISAVKFAGVPALSTPSTIKTTATVASNDATTIWYGVAANTTLPTGTYSNTVTYTLTTN